MNTCQRWGSFAQTIVGILLGIAIQGCGNAASAPAFITAAESKCPGDSAAIRVGDGFFQILCGCTLASEASGTIFSTPGSLTCHLSSSTSIVYFYYLGNALRHQILSTGTPTFTSSGLSDPSQPTPIRVHTVSFSTPNSTYDFQEAINGLTGKIFVP